MVRIKWIITDDIGNVSLKEFNAEWTNIFGYFELDINDQTVGYCPDRELLPDEREFGDEEITDWLYKLSSMIVQLENRNECEWDLLSLNLAKIVIKKDDVLTISLMHRFSGEIWWSEKVTTQEYITELLSAVDRFVEEIRTLNSELLKSKTLTNIIEIRDTLSHSPLLNSPNS